MSSFTGKFREYPTISADNFEKENLSSLAFFLSHCHKDHMSGLDSNALHQRLIGSKTVFVYCSETTENLLMCNPSYSHLREYIRSIPLEQQTMIPLFDEETEEQSSICVTLLPAGHCVGSVMFLFEGQHGNVLYTGDFRLSKGDVRRIPFFHANGRIKDIKSIYIDTTFCLPKMISLPTREQSRNAIIELIDRWFSRGPQYAVSLLCKGMYGFEYLLKEVAMNYKTKIHVSTERLAMYKYLPDMTPYFTTDGRSTRIHACKWESNCHCESDLPCGLSAHPTLKMKVLRIKPTSMWVARDTEPMPADFKRYDKEKRLWRVVHSMHASMEEVQDIVGYLRPYHVYPNVPPAGLESLEDAFERLKGLSRLHECDSCNQDSSAEELFKEQAARHCAEEEKKPSGKAEPIKVLPVIRQAPTEKVLAQCKELGIEEEKSLAPVPKRRKAKFSGVMDEKKAIKLEQTTETTTSDSQRNLEQKPVEHSRDFCGSTSPTVSSSLSHHVMSLPALQDEPNKGHEDREERGPQISQTASTSRAEVRTLDKSKQFDKDTNGESNEADQSKCNDLGVKPFRNSKEGEIEVQSDPFPESSGDDFVDTNRAQTNSKDVDTKSSGDVVERITKEHSSLLIENNFSDQTKATKCLSSVESFSGSEENLHPGGVTGEFLGNKLNFNVPPSPGHVEPRPDKLSSLHQLIQSGAPIRKRKL